MMNLNFMTCNTESKPRQGKSHTIAMTMTNKLTLTLFAQICLLAVSYSY